MATSGRKAGKYAQTVRVLRLLEYLGYRHYGATYAELAEEFEVTERQVRRDLEVLEDAAHRLERSIGGDGRVRVKLESVQPRAVRLTQRERYALLAVRKVFDVLEGTPLEEDVKNIVTKLTGSLSSDEAEELRRFSDRIVYVPDGGTKTYNDDILDALLTGTLRRLHVRYRYETTTAGVHEGVLLPYSMLLYRQGLYVLGVPADRSARRPHAYAVERFETAEFIRGTSFEVPKTFRADSYYDSTFGLFMGDEPQHVVVEFSPQVRASVLARRLHSSQKVTMLPDGGVRLEFDVANVTQLFTWVMGWGRHARLLGPPNLVERVRAEVSELAELYRTSGKAKPVSAKSNA